MAEKIARQLSMGLVVVGLIALSGCSSAQLTSTWSPPDAQPITFKKVIVVCFTEDKVTRRVAEDALVQDIKKAEAVASYQLIPDAKLHDLEQVKVRIAEAGFDGAITMRLLAKRKEATNIAPIEIHRSRSGYRSGRSFSGDYGRH